MKKPAFILASLFALAALTPLTAEAGRGGHDRGRGHGGYSRPVHDDCERPVRMVKVCVGHDRHGCAIYRWVPAPVRHHDGGYSRGGHGRGHGAYGGHHSRSRSGITIRIGG